MLVQLLQTSEVLSILLQVQLVGHDLVEKKLELLFETVPACYMLAVDVLLDLVSKAV